LILFLLNLALETPINPKIVFTFSVTQGLLQKFFLKFWVKPQWQNDFKSIF